MSSYKKNYNYFKGVFLVTGTCIGAGMIGVPVKTAAAGFLPTLAAFGVVWLVMTISALLLLEVSLSFPGEVNFISMTNAMFGKLGRNIAWVICLLFMYSIMAAFASGGATMITRLFPIDIKIAILIFMLPFVVIIDLGPKWVAIVNRILTIIVIASFMLLCITIVFSKTHALQPVKNLFIHTNLKVLLFSLPVIVTTFAYHEIIPSLKFYLKEEIFPLKMAIILGGIIPLIVYIAWELVILLLVPVFGTEGLISMLHSNKNPGDSLINYLLQSHQNAKILVFLVSFSFCALACSLTGTAWALFDFFADGLNITKNRKGKILLSCLTFLPSIMYAVIFPQGFLKALGFAGAFSAIIMIIYPALMAYKLRSQKSIVTELPVKYRVPVNKPLIIVILLFGVFILILEGISNFAK